MTNYKKLGTRKIKEPAIFIEEANEAPLSVSQSATDGKTELQIKSIVETGLGKSFSDLWIHINRDGTIAIATGKEPNEWPEDIEADPSEAQ